MSTRDNDNDIAGAFGTIRAIAERTVPQSLATIDSRGPVRGTLELAAGTAERLDIRVGDKVLRGEEIGYVGMTGVTTGPLLTGVKFGREIIETETVIYRSVTGTVRRIHGEHRQMDKFRLD